MSEVELTHVTVGGLEVCLATVPWARSFAAVLQVGSGCGADPGGLAGLAHLCEHERIAHAARLVPAAEVTVNGLTESGWTRFQCSADVTTWRSAVDRVLAMFDPGQLDNAGLAAETSAMLIEMERTGGRPALRLGPLMAAAALPGSDLARLGEASADTVHAIGHEDMKVFLDRHYRPGNARLIVASPVPADEIVTHLSAWDGPWRADGLPRADDPPGAVASPAVAELDGTWVVTLAVSRPATSQGVAAAVAGKVTLDGDGLIERVSRRHGHRVTGAAVLHGGSHDLAVLSWGTAQPSAAVLRDMRRLFDGDPEFSAGRERLERARHLAAVTHSFEHQTMSGLAGQLARWLNRTGPRPMSVDDFRSVPLRDIGESVAALLSAARLWHWDAGRPNPLEM
ncbi:hypothetical protein ACWDUI_14325 [Streptosporangium sandarakinum]